MYHHWEVHKFIGYSIIPLDPLVKQGIIIVINFMQVILSVQLLFTYFPV